MSSRNDPGTCERCGEENPCVRHAIAPDQFCQHSRRDFDGSPIECGRLLPCPEHHPNDCTCHYCYIAATGGGR